jgi:hypothetical protein
VEVYSLRGERILSAEMIGERMQEFMMQDAPSGLYFVKIIGVDYTETIKLVKTK